MPFADSEPSKDEMENVNNMYRMLDHEDFDHDPPADLIDGLREKDMKQDRQKK